VIRTVNDAVTASGVSSPADVRAHPRLVSFSSEMRELTKEMKRFLFANLYRHPRVMASRENAKQILRDLFEVYCERPGEMQAGYAKRAIRHVNEAGPEHGNGLQRVVADYVSGMTDRFAVQEYERLVGLAHKPANDGARVFDIG
jgi:dGTPase